MSTKLFRGFAPTAKTRAAIVFSAAVALLAFCCTAAQADIIIYSLDQYPSAPSPSPDPAPYGTVTVTLNSGGTDATITFASNTVGGYSFIDSHSADFNVNATNFTVTVTSTDASGGTAAIVSESATNVDHIGTFNNEFKSTDSPPVFTTVTFDVQDTSGTWANAASVLTTTGNGQGFLAGAHIIDSVTPTANTFFVGNGPGSPGSSVPEPASLTLWSLLGIAGVVFRRRKKTAV